MTNNFLSDINNAKEKINDLSTELASGSKIQKASDSPDGTGKLLRWKNQLDQSNTYSSNIDTGLSYVTTTTNTMQNIQGEITDVLTSLSNLKNPSVSPDMSNYADKINQTLNSIIEQANTTEDGKYVFGGTDFSSAPYGISSDGSSVDVQVNDVSGVQNIRTSSGTTQQINMTGTEVFGTTVSLNGTIDSGTAVGNTVSQSTTVYDATGNQYTLNLNFTKTAANTYNMTYDILDGTSTSVFSSPPAAQPVTFDPASGNLQTINGQPASDIHVKVDSKKIDFMMDTSGTREKSGTTSLNFSANQKTDIFNTLMAIKNNLKAGIMPTDEQFQAVSDFNSRILDNISKTGNMTNQLSNAKSLLSSNQTQLTSLIANEQNVDVAKATLDLQNQNTMLQMAYQIAASTLTKSLLSYL